MGTLFRFLVTALYFQSYFAENLEFVSPTVSKHLVHASKNVQYLNSRLQIIESFPCEGSENFRIVAGFMFNGSSYLFGRYNGGTTCWLVRLRETKGSRWYKVVSGYPKADSRWKNEDFAQFPTYIDCPSAALMVNQTLYLFHDKWVYSFTSSNVFNYVRWTTFQQSVFALDEKVMSVEGAALLKYAGHGYIIKFTVWIERKTLLVFDKLFIAPQFFLYQPGSNAQFLGALDDREKKEYLSELSGFRTNRSSSFGYQFFDGLSILSEHRFGVGDFQVSKYSEHALLQGVVGSKFHSFSSAIVVPSDMPYGSYIIPVESWFGCALDPFCLLYQLDGIVHYNHRFYVFLDENVYETRTLGKRLRGQPKPLKSEFGGQITTYVDAVIGLPPQNATKLYLFKDDIFHVYELHGSRISNRKINDAFGTVNKVMAALSLEENSAYLYQEAVDQSFVKRYLGIGFEVDLKAKLNETKTISEVNNILPAYVDTVFQRKRQVFTVVKQFYTVQPTSTFYYQQATRGTFKLFPRANLFGCSLMNAVGGDLQMINLYEANFKPIPHDSSVVTSSVPGSVTPIATGSSGREDPVHTFSTGSTKRQPGRPSIFETISTRIVAIETGRVVAIIVGLAATLALGLAIGVGMYYYTGRREKRSPLHGVRTSYRFPPQSTAVQKTRRHG